MQAVIDVAVVLAIGKIPRGIVKAGHFLVSIHKKTGGNSPSGRPSFHHLFIFTFYFHGIKFSKLICTDILLERRYFVS
jgi:hypothetical protein